MSVPYEAPAAPRFVVEYKSGGEEIRIGASRHVFVSLFLAIWLCGWTTGGFSAIRMLAAIGFQPFLTLWLCGWALGEGFVLLTLAWMLRGSEVIRIAGGDLEIRAELFGFVKRRIFRGSDIHGLAASAVPFFGRSRSMSLPIVFANRYGAVKLSYGARTIYIAPDLDETEGRMIVDRIQKALPASAR